MITRLSTCIIGLCQVRGVTMRIEIDTKHDSREELAHLADMLRAIAGSHSVVSASDARLQRRLARQGMAQSDLSGSAVSSPSQSGIFSLFDDGQSQAAQEPCFPRPSSEVSSAQQPSGDIFSLFNSSPGEQPQSSAFQQSSPSSSVLLQESDADGLPEEKKSGLREILDDDRIIPY